MVIASAMYVAPIYILRLFIDALIQDDFTMAILIRYVSLFAGAILLGYIAEFIWTFNLFIGSYDLQKQLRQQLMKHFLNMGAPFYHRFRTGDLMTRSSDDVQVIRNDRRLWVDGFLEYESLFEFYRCHDGDYSLLGIDNHCTDSYAPLGVLHFQMGFASR